MKRLIKSFGYAIHGLYFVYKNEANMRIHILAAFLILLLAFLLNFKTWEWTMTLLCIGIVFSLEILNTIIEKYLDFYHPQKSERIKILKDMAAGMVLISTIFAIIIGVILVGPKLIETFSLKK